MPGVARHEGQQDGQARVEGVGREHEEDDGAQQPVAAHDVEPLPQATQVGPRGGGGVGRVGNGDQHERRAGGEGRGVEPQHGQGAEPPDEGGRRGDAQQLGEPFSAVEGPGGLEQRYVVDRADLRQHRVPGGLTGGVEQARRHEEQDEPPERQADRSGQQRHRGDRHGADDVAGGARAAVADAVDDGATEHAADDDRHDRCGGSDPELQAAAARGQDVEGDGHLGRRVPRGARGVRDDQRAERSHGRGNSAWRASTGRVPARSRSERLSHRSKTARTSAAI